MMKNLRIPLCIHAVAALSSIAVAAQPTPGQYVTEHGWGHLTIKQAQGKLTFTIDAFGANAHICNLEGEIRKDQAVLGAGDGTKPCVVSFTDKNGGVQVDTNQAEGCREYCGVRAQFEGLYLKPAPGCEDASRARARKTFKQLYDKKAYAEALATLSPVLQQCGPTLDWLETGWLRNDIALTQLKLGKPADCLTTLAPLANDAALSDEDLRGNYLPSDAESYLPIVKATRTNLRLCKAKVP